MFHYAPLDLETLRLVNNLIKINQLGFVSLEGQPGDCFHGNKSINIIGGNRIESDYINNTKVWGVEQVSYIIGFYPTEKKKPIRKKIVKL